MGPRKVNKNSLDRLIELLTSLPGVGEKTANRLALYILRSTDDYAESLSKVICEVKTKVGFCRSCQDLTEGEICTLCRDSRRDPSTLCVVEQSAAMSAMERTGQYRGLYHILHGSLSPLQSIGPEELKLDRLRDRVRKDDVIQEVILALNSDPEGEATSLYLKEYLQDLSIRVTRIAFGIPVGAHVEYTDPITLSRALQARQEISKGV